MFRHIATGKFLEKGIKNYENKPKLFNFYVTNVIQPLLVSINKVSTLADLV